MVRHLKFLVMFLICIFSSKCLFAQFQNYRVSSFSVTDPNEVTIAVNPASPSHLAAGANMRYIYTSNDSGKTWSETSASSTLGTAGDPVLIYDRFGNLYYQHLSYPAGGAWIDRMVIQKSANNGGAFSNGAGVGLNGSKNQDKGWLAADMTSTLYKDNIYLTWTEFDLYGVTTPTDSSRILASYSTDHGVTWSTPVRVSDRGGDCVDSDNTVEGAVPAIGPNGEVYVTWSGHNEITFDKSLDGGKTFGKDIFVANQPGGWDYAISGIYRCNGMPITMCDVSNAKTRGNIYVVWGDTRNGTNDADIFCIKSTDGGNTWGNTIRVNNDNTRRQQFFPWATIDQTTGYIYVVFYDRRNYSDNQTDVYLAVSTDGGVSFQNVKVSQTPFTPVSNIFFGDYICITALNGNIYPIWMRMDVSNMSVWTAHVTQDALNKTFVGIDDNSIMKTPAGYELAQNYPNPFNPQTTISYKIPESSKVVIKLYDINGREVDTIFDGFKQAGQYQINYDASKLSSGRYIYKLIAGNTVLTGKMILQK